MLLYHNIYWQLFRQVERICVDMSFLLLVIIISCLNGKILVFISSEQIFIEFMRNDKHYKTKKSIEFEKIFNFHNLKMNHEDLSVLSLNEILDFYIGAWEKESYFGFS